MIPSVEKSEKRISLRGIGIGKLSKLIAHKIKFKLLIKLRISISVKKIRITLLSHASRSGLLKRLNRFQCNHALFIYRELVTG